MSWLHQFVEGAGEIGMEPMFPAHNHDAIILTHLASWTVVFEQSVNVEGRVHQLAFHELSIILKCKLITGLVSVLRRLNLLDDLSVVGVVVQFVMSHQ
ncbi:13189_t:CDS:2, partial [Ambispora gerdemannii]